VSSLSEGFGDINILSQELFGDGLISHVLLHGELVVFLAKVDHVGSFVSGRVHLVGCHLAHSSD
jgi:hypothetical protein